MSDTGSELTRLLHEWSHGDPVALDRLAPLVFEELHRLARAHFVREPQAHTLQPTALVNEVFVRLMGRRRVSWENRAQFFQGATELMRHILVDHARRRRSAKRGGDACKVSLDDVAIPIKMPGVDALALAEALEEIARENPQYRDVVELKFYFGLTNQEIGDVLGIATATVKLRWTMAKARLYRRLKEQ